MDITRYGEWSPENQGGRWSGDPGHGARFTGANRKGIMRWSTHCEVIEYEQPQLDPKDADAAKIIKERGGKLLLEEGYISLQAESHPVEFRKVEIKVLKK